jgi:hypothetical protein
MLFMGFMFLVSGSLFFQDGTGLKASSSIKYMLFMVFVPYLCGRLMRKSGIVFLMRITIVTGIVILPFLLIDRFTFPDNVGRLSFFGQDHAILLIGELLAVALIALCVNVLSEQRPSKKNNRLSRFAHYGLIGLVTVLLVWLTARGWLIAGLAGVTVVSLSARQCPIWKRFKLLATVFFYCLGIFVRIAQT